MLHPVNPAIAATFAPPVMAARRWLKGMVFSKDRPLLNVSQAAPVDLPPLALRQEMADAALNRADAHLYGDVLGMDQLRAEIALQWSRAYGGVIAPAQVAITQGCNQAFTSVMATLAGQGDEVIIPTPWYFNHKMWLDMQGVRAVPLPTQDDLMPDPARARALISPRTRAIVLVSPNNPGGVEYSAELVGAFRDLCRAHRLALVIDETYRDFDSREGRPHELFTDPSWDDTVIQLYSFSKAYRLTGHRVGAMVASTARLAEVEKFLDTVAICPSQIGQIAALWGMQNLAEWLAGERAEILTRRAAMMAGFAALPAWRLLGCGAYFAYAAHPYDMSSPDLAQKLLRDAAILSLPGVMFQPDDHLEGQRQLRFAFANINRDEIQTFFTRMNEFHHTM